MRQISDEQQQPGHDGAPVRAESDATPPPMIGQDERRMHVRAYNFWANLLGTRSFPAIEDLDLDQLGDFGTHAVLLDFTSGIDNPAISFVGEALLGECDLEPDAGYIADVPRGSLLSRLTDHYLQIIANRAPIGFEAEFVNKRGATIMYRGVLLPFSSDDDSIDFILGVINWKEAAEAALADSIAREVAAAAAVQPVARLGGAMPLWADGPDSAHANDAGMDADDADHGDEIEDNDGGDDLILDVELPGLADRLSVARACAAVAQQNEARGHKSLYDAVGRTWDFALAIAEAPEDFAELVDEAGLTISSRSPMTAVAKLVFGIGYDKTRLAEITTVLRYAEREQLNSADLVRTLTTHAGGIKGLVKAERAAARPTAKLVADKGAQAKAVLRSAASMARIIGLPGGDEEFIVLVARRDADGLASVVAQLDPQQAEQALARLGSRSS